MDSWDHKSDHNEFTQGSIFRTDIGNNPAFYNQQNQNILSTQLKNSPSVYPFYNGMSSCLEPANFSYPENRSIPGTSFPQNQPNSHPIYQFKQPNASQSFAAPTYPFGYPCNQYPFPNLYNYGAQNQSNQEPQVPATKQFPYDTAVTITEGSCSRGGLMEGLLATGMYRECSDWKVDLENVNMWRPFHSSGSEMILTKSGRHIFPSVCLRIGGLTWDRRYHLVTCIIPTSDKKHKFQSGKWSITSKIEPDASLFRRSHSMSDNPIPGYLLHQEVVKLNNLKITNNSFNNNNIFLQSMKQYRIEVTIYEACSETQLNGLLLNCKTFRLPFTEFVAVTAYQNAEIRRLKIENNPFAKGFRDNGKRKTNTELEENVTKKISQNEKDCSND